MLPKSLSATSVQVFEECPARWKAEKLNRVDGLVGSPAWLGTVCHGALERWVSEGFYLLNAGQSRKGMMTRLYTEEYWKLFPDDSRFSEGLELVLNWLDRQDWTGREVLTAEVKQNFVLEVDDVEVPFNFILDRCDKVGDDEIEVIDYKTFIRPINADYLRSSIQGRSYALAARILYPWARRIWVTFDLLRYEPVGTVFTAEEVDATGEYLLDTLARILKSDGTEEVLNPGCRWCIRKFACESLTKHVGAGGPLGISDAGEAADRKVQLEATRGALDSMIDELNGVIVEHMEREQVLEFDTDRTRVTITSQRRREIDTKMARRVIGDHVIASHASLTLKEVDLLLKGDEITDEQKSNLRRLIRGKFTSPTVKAEPIKGLS